MSRYWMKTSVNYTLVGEGHEKGAKYSFANIAKDVDADKIVKFGKVLETLTNDKVSDATIAVTDHITAE
ncbi:hypothetical protein [Lentilactobacillus sp. Marseille-Q4993]|uniref:DUF1659 domain-containing protein n=1 Tax=Lentilactobacillus sp. Marseille-Q4993 TaxID=3039492 RepID=UPI0024BD5600|nr:hypothetical protein [Lentilactobacillus sp. Marseille-Q4993]